MDTIHQLKSTVKQKGLKYFFTETIPIKLNRHLNNITYFVLGVVLKKLPLNNTIIIESHNDFDSNGGAFYDYLIQNGYNQKYKIVWFLRNKCSGKLPYNVKSVRYNHLGIKKVYYHYTARYIICEHYVIASVRDGQKSYYLTHGALSLKNPKGYINLPKEISYYLVPSEFIAPMHAKLYGFSYPNRKELVLGYPCHDILYQPGWGDLVKITSKKYKKVILWMPTFRKMEGEKRVDSRFIFPMGIPIIKDEEKYENLNRILQENNCLLIIRIHPMQDLSSIKIRSKANIVVLDEGNVKKLKIDNYRLMKDADALITDYSSVAFDFIHLNRPLGFTVDDIKEYGLGFIVGNPEKLMPGFKICDYNCLIKFIQEIVENKDIYKKERNDIFNKVFKYHDGYSSERLAEHMGIK